MTMRSAPGGTARRAYNYLTRGTLISANDAPQMQEVNVNLLHEEQRQDIERWQPYGFSSVPKGPTGKKFAEVLIAWFGGSRSHGAVIAIDDRRYRPRGLKEGEAALYDDQGQKVHITRDGVKIDGNGKPQTFTVGNATVKIENGKITLTVGSMNVFVQADRIDLGGLGGSKVMTESGASQIVFAKLAL